MMDFFTFFIYTFIMLFCIWMGHLLSIIPITKVCNNKRVYNEDFYCITYITIVIYTSIVGFRYNVGVDYVNYLEWYKSYCIKGIYPVNGQDKFFLYINYVLKEIGGHFCILFILLALPLISSLMRGLRHVQFLYAYYFFFFFTIIFNESMNVMRQIAAFYMWFCAYALLFEKKKRQAIIVATLGVLMHKSSLLALLWYPFVKLDLFRNKKLAYILLIASFIGGFFLYDYFKIIFVFLAPYMGDRLANYADGWQMEQIELYTEANQGEGIAAIAYLIIDLLIVKYSKILRNKYANNNFSFYYNLFLIGEILTPIVAANTIFMRVNYYFMLHKIIILSFFCHYVFAYGGKYKFVSKLCGIAIIAIYTFLHYRHILNSTSINPYRTIFFLV